jgi:hypothetical protein
LPELGGKESLIVYWKVEDSGKNAEDKRHTLTKSPAESGKSYPFAFVGPSWRLPEKGGVTRKEAYTTSRAHATRDAAAGIGRRAQ